VENQEKGGLNVNTKIAIFLFLITGVLVYPAYVLAALGITLGD